MIASAVSYRRLPLTPKKKMRALPMERESNSTVFESDSCMRRRHATTREAHEAMELVDSFDRVEDKEQHMYTLGMDYRKVSTYLPIVERLNRVLAIDVDDNGIPRTATNPIVLWWDYLVAMIMFMWTVITTDL
jgi:hypothetical protein